MNVNLSVVNNKPMDSFPQVKALTSSKIESSSGNNETLEVQEKKNLENIPGMNDVEQSSKMGKNLMIPDTYSVKGDVLSVKNVDRTGQEFDKSF